jgi:hypothetical protein
MAESWQPQKSQPKPQRRSRQRRSRNKNILAQHSAKTGCWQPDAKTDFE